MPRRPDVLEGVDAGDGFITITVTDYLAADDLSRAFGIEDRHFTEVQAAMAKAWPSDRGDTDAR